MNRRRFISLTARGALAATWAGAAGGCSPTPDPALESWRGARDIPDDPRWYALAFAVLAPNPHNSQAWRVRLTGSLGLNLYVDPVRVLRASDPYLRQIVVGHGAFLELFDLAAREQGYRTDLLLFPNGADDLESPGQPVATVRLVRDPTTMRDRLFPWILQRHSNKRPYDDQPLTADQRAGLAPAGLPPGLAWGFTEGPRMKEQLARLLTEGMRVDAEDDKRNRETLAYFRFSSEERAVLRDGIGLAQTGMGPIAQWFVERFYARQDALADLKRWARESIELTARQVKAASAYAWLATGTNTRADQVQAGRAYARADLQAAALGVAQHPLSQVLQEYPAMAPLMAETKRLLGVPDSATIQMLYRLGHADRVPHTPRRRPEDLLWPGIASTAIKS